MDVFNIRREFTQKGLDEKDVCENPIEQFETWFIEALNSEAIEPNAMILSTSTTEGKPSSRVVLLKQFTDKGFSFFTNYESHKGKDLFINPYCALNFVWHELERQVRIEGIAERLPETESDKYFEIRPEKSKLGAWASPQSKVIPNRQYIEEQEVKFNNEFIGQTIKRPDNWGGYIVKPLLIEFWQGRRNRLHDRIQYRLGEKEWIIERLAP